MLQAIIELAKGIGDLSKTRRAEKRAEWDRIAEHMSQIAVAIEQACSALGDRKAPYREYVMLQRYAEGFLEIVEPAFRRDQEKELQKLHALLEDSITSIAGFDILLLGFRGVPIPQGLYSSKAGLLRERVPEQNPPLEEADLSIDPPTLEDLEEAAAVFRAEADKIRASRV